MNDPLTHLLPPQSSSQPGQSTRFIPMDRRSFLKGVGAIALAQLLSGCQAGSRGDFSIQFLQSSMPTALLREFRQQYRSVGAVDFKPVETLPILYENLLAWQTQNTGTAADWMTLGDYWLTPAIRQNLIEPVDVRELDGWNALPEPWQNLVTRDRQGMPARNELTWGAPYRWSSLVIVYKTETFEELGWTPTDWQDLWNPDLEEVLSLPNSPRLVIGLALKRLGESFNTETLSAVDELPEALRALQAQVKQYSSGAYLQPLILGDTQIAVGWSTDILPLLRRDRRFAAVIPQSGTALTADIWVRPTRPLGDGDAAEQPDAADLPLREWITFCWQPDVAQRLTIQSLAASPVLVGGDRTLLPETLTNDNILLPEVNILDQSEFLAPLSDEALVDYENLWTAMRLGNL